MAIVDWHDWEVDHDIVKQLKSGPIPGEHWQGDGKYKRAILHILDEEILSLREYKPAPCEGRGIVICTSAKSGRSSGKHLHNGYFPASWVNYHELRRFGCDLPVTMAFLGFDEMDPYLTNILIDMGINLIDLRWIDWTKDRMRILAGWETKIFAIEHCQYDEVLFLDADNIPLKNPSHLFDTYQFRETGAIFWPDVSPSRRSEWVPKEVWHAIGEEYRPYTDFESGQLMFSKKKCFNEMKVCRLLNEYSDYWYKLVFGDKSTFFLAWQKLGTPYGIPGRLPRGEHKTLIQHDLDHSDLFQHCVGGKPTLAGYPSTVATRGREFHNKYIENLRSLWDGQLWKSTNSNQKLLPDYSGIYHYKRSIDANGRDIELLADGSTGVGRARCEHSWEVHECPLKGAVILIRDDNAKPIAVFARHNEQWIGQWIDHERCYCTLDLVRS